MSTTANFPSSGQTDAQQKKELRAQIRARRQAMSAAARAEATTGITAQLTALVSHLRPMRIACYLATATEPETRPFIDWALDSGLEVLLPVSRDDGLLDWAFAEADVDPVTGRHDLPEPAGERLGVQALSTVDLAFIPASAVDRAGTRMGWGLGYYDKSLAALEVTPPLFALVYDEEVVDLLPRESHDVPASGIITPTSTIAFR